MTASFSYTSSGLDHESISHENEVLKLQLRDLEKRMQIMQANQERERLRLKSEIETRRMDEKQRQEYFEQSVSQLQSQVSSSKIAVRSKMKENIQLSTEIDVFLSQVAERTSNDIKEFNDVLRLIDDLKAKSNDEAKKAGELDEKYFQMNLENEKLGRMIEKKEYKIEEAKRKARQEAEKQAEGHQAVVREMKMKIKRHEKIIAKMAKVMENLKEENEYLKKRKEEEENAVIVEEKPEIDPTVQLLEARIVMMQAKLDEREQICESQESEIEELKKSLECSQAAITELNGTVDDLTATIETKDKELKQASLKQRQTTQKVHALRDTIRQMETREMEFSTEIRELKLLLQQEKVEEIPKIEPVERAKTEVVVAAAEIVESYEEVMSAQGEEIVTLQRQRNELLTKIKSMLQYIESSERFTDQLLTQLKEQSAAHEQEKENWLENKTREIEEEHVTFNEIMKKIPKELIDRVEEFAGQPITYQFINTVELLLENRKAVDQETKETNDVKKDESRNVHIIGHLANICRCVKSLAGGLESDTEKTDILKQCARVERFVDECQMKTEDVPALLNFREADMATVSKTLMEFVSDPSELQESPVRELYLLFCCFVHVNKILMERSDEYKIRINDLRTKLANQEQLEERLTKLDQWKNRYEGQHDRVYEILSKHVENPDEDVAVLAGQVNDVIAQRDKAMNELRAQTKEQAELLQNRIKEMHKEAKKQGAEKEELCAQVEVMANEIEQSAIEQMKKHEEEMKEQEDVITDLKEKSAKQVEYYEQKVAKSKSEIEEMFQQKAELEEEIHSLKKQVNALFAKCAEQEDETAAVRSELEQTTGKLAKAIEHKNHYKSKLEEANTKNAQAIAQIQEKCETLQSQYETIVDDLTEKLQTAKGELDQANAHIAGFDAEKQELQHEKARLTISEKSLSVKLGSALQQLERERNAAAARELALNNSWEVKMAAQTNEKASERELLLNLLAKCSQYWLGKQLPAASVQLKPFFEKEIERKQESDETLILKDAVEARKILKARSLTDAVKLMTCENSDLKDELALLRKENALMSDASSRSAATLRKAEAVGQEGREWFTWGKSMLRQVAEGANVGDSHSELRMKIEELLLDTMSKRRTVRKMEILRKEKQYLMRNGELLKQAPWKSSTKSVRPLILVASFALRMAKMQK